jgi:hypothetical protein
MMNALIVLQPQGTLVNPPLTSGGVPILPAKGDNIVYDSKVYVVQQTTWHYGFTPQEQTSIRVYAHNLEDLS